MGENFGWILTGLWLSLHMGRGDSPTTCRHTVAALGKATKRCITIPALHRNPIYTRDSGERWEVGVGWLPGRKPCHHGNSFLHSHIGLNTRWFINSQEGSELILWRGNGFWQYSEECICLGHWFMGSWLVFQNTWIPLFSEQTWRMFS